jgi:2-isopropylmalate synthase
MTPDQKVHAAAQLDRLGVDVIEAGFPAASPGDAGAVLAVSRVTDRAEVAALARCVRPDIDAAMDALCEAQRPVLHVFIATSDIHLKHKLRKGRTEILDQVAENVQYAAGLGPRVEFSAEDATRSDWDFLACVCNVAVQAGATTINLPDTVGHAVPEEYAAMFRYVRDRISGAREVVFSAHCHDDLGLATANSLAAIAAGARQVEVTVNGIGERAGNAALEEVVMGLKTRADVFDGAATGVDTREILNASRLVSSLTGIPVQANKAIVGVNAFAHEAGIHQDGVIKERTTYEIMSPADVGWERSRLVLGKHSGRHGVAHRLGELGVELDPVLLDTVYARFVEVADGQKEVTDEQLRQIVTGVTDRIGVPSATGGLA